LALCASLLEGRRWYLFGAQAVNVHARARATQDIDFTVLHENPSSDIALVRRFVASGFQLLRTDWTLATQVQSGIIQLSRGGDLVDLVIGQSGLEQGFWERRTTVQVLGCEIPVIGAADLVVNKVFAARPKDLDDVMHILQAHPDLDLDHCRSLLALLERALDQSDLLPSLEMCLQRARES
jgi:hypothetical protein